MSLEQFQTAVVAARNHFAKKNKRTSWFQIVFLVIIAFSLAIAMQTFSEYLRGFCLGFYAFAVLLVLWCKWQSNRTFRKSYEAQQKQLNGQIMNIDESGISGRWENGNASYQYKWSAFESFLELPDGFLFFANPAFFVRIPKSSLNLDEQQMIKTWRQNVG
jgi:hypothetical protein